MGGERWTGFKYTKNESRARWIDSLSPYASTIASILPKIDWAGFRYDGLIEIELEEPERPKHNIQCRSVAPVEYQVFGGGACELWGIAVPEVPIRKYVDFTGDLDVRVNPPPYIIKNDGLDPKLKTAIDLSPGIDLILLNEHGFTAYGQALTRWLYDEVVNRVREISPYFNKPGFVVPDYREDDETAISDLQTVVGNLLVCRSPMLDRNMIKIQVTAKIETDSIAEMNHIVEFIFSPKGNFAMRNNSFRVNGIYLQEPKKLLRDQVLGLVGRGTGIINASAAAETRPENYPSFYKFDNHCARILYIAHLLKTLEGKRIAGSPKPVEQLGKADVVGILEKIYAASCDKLCSKHFGDDYMDQLITVFETMDLIRAGGLTTKLNRYGVAQITAAKAKARAVGGRRLTRRVGGERWVGFKYTRDEKRGRWVDALSPYASTIASILPKMYWAGFRYDGPVQIETEQYNASGVSGFKGDEAPRFVVRTAHCRSDAPLEYQVFGGGACELWGLAVPEVPIRKYVDFTGDLDVRVNPPPLIVDDSAFNAALAAAEIDYMPSSSKPILLGEQGFTEYGEALTRWLYNQVVDRAREISPYFNRPGFMAPDYREDDETAVSDLQTVVGNLLVCRSPMLDKEMIKIQITAKVESGLTGEMNHIMELILTTKGRFEIIRGKIFRVNGIYVQQPRMLLLDQVKGLVGRGTSILNSFDKRPEIEKVENYPAFFKFDNHCARILYLAHLQKAVEGKPIGDPPKKADNLIKPEVLRIMENIYAASCDKLCSKHFGDGYMDQLIAVFESMDYVKAGYLTTRIDPKNRAGLNRAKAKGRAVGGRRRTRRTRLH